jgi:hypothetical protein
VTLGINLQLQFQEDVMHRVHNVLPMRWFLTLAILLFLYSSAVGQTSVPFTTSRYIYWTNYKTGAVGRATITGTSPNESFIKTGVAGGAGLTATSQFLYWTSANGGTATTILRANLNGTGLNKKFITGASNPCGITHDSTYIYWGGDVGTTIGRAKLDGSDVDHNFIATGTGVCGVAVTSTHIYWANYRTGKIGRANLNGSSPNLSFIPTVGAGSLSIQGSFIYWPSNSGTTIGRANLNGTGVNQNFIKGLSGVAFIATDSTYIYWGTGETGTTIGRAKLDGTDVNKSLIKGTLGSFGIAVTAGSP